MWDNYTKVSKIDEGGMGEVWLVTHKKQRVLYAAKFLKPDLTRPKDYVRFSRELKTLSQLDHINIIKLFDVSNDISNPGYTMEYCSKGNLKDKIENNVSLNIDHVMTSLIEAVIYLHKNNFIHRDIKPQNILFSPDDCLRLSDFGLVIADDTDRTVVTTSNWRSYGFSPPEQYRNMATVTKQGDIFSVGAIYFFLLTKRVIDISIPLENQIKHFKSFDYYFLSKTLAYDSNQRFPDTIYLQLTFEAKASDDKYRWSIFDFLNRVDTDKKEFLRNESNRITGDFMILQELAEDFIDYLKLLIRLETNDELRAFIVDTLKAFESDYEDDFEWVMSRS